MIVSVNTAANTITVDGETLRFRFPRSIVLKEIEWNGTEGTITAVNGNTKPATWDVVEFYVLAFQAEKAKREVRPLLDAYKALRRRVIEAKREAAIASGVVWNGHEFDSDRQSIQNIALISTIVALGATIPANFGWRDKNNELVPINTTAELRSFLVAIALHLRDKYVQSWSIKDLVDAAQTHEAVDAVDWQ